MTEVNIAPATLHQSWVRGKGASWVRGKVNRLGGSYLVARVGGAEMKKAR